MKVEAKVGINVSTYQGMARIASNHQNWKQTKTDSSLEH